MRKFPFPALAEQDPRLTERCTCPSLLPDLAGTTEQAIPLAPALTQALQTALQDHFPGLAPFSLLLFHITCFAYVSPSSDGPDLSGTPGMPDIPQRIAYHASADLLTQILRNIRRTLRTSDQILVETEGTGAALLFPQVDQEGMARIAERVSCSIRLLQAETIIPPLQSETEIALEFG